VTLATTIVVLPIASQDSLSPPSLTLELFGLLVGSFFAALDGSEHSDCYFRRSWDDFATLDCRCWTMGCSCEDNCFVPYSLLALDLQMNTKGKFQ
jgi:hypothetical protein